MVRLRPSCRQIRSIALASPYTELMFHDVGVVSTLILPMIWDACHAYHLTTCDDCERSGQNERRHFAPSRSANGRVGLRSFAGDRSPGNRARVESRPTTRTATATATTGGNDEPEPGRRFERFRIYRRFSKP